MNDSIFKTELEVRDYECDMEGIVNNAVYLNYLEHARHGYIQTRGFNFHDLTRQGIHLVVFRIEADYLFPLHSGDRFYVSVTSERVSKIRLCMSQEIFRLPDEKPVMKAKVFVTSLTAEGKPKHFETLDRLFA